MQHNPNPPQLPPASIHHLLLVLLILRFLSVSPLSFLSLCSFLLVFLFALPLPRLPRIPCHLSNSIPLCLSIICTRACISARLSVSRPSPLAPALEPAVLRLSPRYDHLRIRLPSTRPRSAPEQPSIRYRCVQPRGEGLSAIARIEGCSGLRMRAYTPKSVPTSSPCIATHS